MASPLRAAPAELAGWLRFNVPHPGCGLQACTLRQRAGDIRHLDLWLISARRRCQHAPGNLALLPAAVRRAWRRHRLAGPHGRGQHGLIPDEWPLPPTPDAPRRRILFVFTVQNKSVIEGASP